MSGIFPTPTGVPAEDTDNGYEPALAPIGGPARFYGRECQTVLYYWALNALTSEILAAVDRLGYAYNSSRVDNLGAALADVVGNLQAHLTSLDNLTASLDARVDAAELDIDDLETAMGVVQTTLMAHGVDITNIQNFLADLDDGDIALDPPIAGFNTLTAFLNAVVPMVGPMPATSIKGNNTGATGSALNLTPAEVAAMLPLALAGAKGLLAALSSNARQYMDGTGSWSEPPLATAAARGTVPTHPNDNTQVLLGNNTWGASPGLSSGACVLHWGPTAPPGTLKANGAAVLIATYPALDTAIYCGNANNPTATWGYRCTNPANPNGSRSTAGTYIVVPDGRGEFLRGWDDGRGIDTGRNQWLAQAQAIESHTHGVTDPQHRHTATWSDGNGFTLNAGGSARRLPFTADGGAGFIDTTLSSTGITINNTGGTETRPRNLAPLICIKY